MTTRIQRLVGMTCLGLAITTCGGDDADSDAPPPEPLIIESPRTHVLVGSDTVLVFGPTMFAYLGMADKDQLPSASALEATQEFLTNVQTARESLSTLGVRVEAISMVPVVQDVPAEVDAAAGPSLANATFGYLFVDEVRHVTRVTSLLQGAEMVCVAARTFGLTLDAPQSASCR